MKNESGNLEQVVQQHNMTSEKFYQSTARLIW